MHEFFLIVAGLHMVLEMQVLGINIYLLTESIIGVGEVFTLTHDK